MYRCVRASYFLITKRFINTLIPVTNCEFRSILTFSPLLGFTALPFGVRSKSFEALGMSYKEVKERFLNMSPDEKRAQYSCGKNYVTLDDIKPITEYFVSKELSFDSQASAFKKENSLNEKVSVFIGDITALEVDAIVNAANNSLRGGGGVDGAIHKGAGKALLAECVEIGGCDTGDAVITGGYKLPAKYVIHTVGPVGEKPDLLRSCYQKSLNVALSNGCKSVAFPCISTGVYGYPNENAAKIAVSTVRNWLQSNHGNVTRIIFCLFLPVDVEIYEKLIPIYFPL